MSMSMPAPTATYHHKPYPAIDPTRAELSAKGKNIVVTGGGTGIGAEIARYFAKAGASRILILGRREAPLLSTKAAIKKDFPNVSISSVSADATKKAEINAAFEAFSKNGKIDVLVSNAGILGLRSAIKDANVDEWFSAIESNIKGAVTVVQSFLKYAAPEAVVINISSAIAHLDITTDGSSYAVAKAGLARFFGALAHEHPELIIYNIQPGLILTDMAKEGGWGDDEADMTEEQKAMMGLFDEVTLPAAFCVWLASPEALFLRGKFLWSNWDVDELKKRKSEIEKGLLNFGLAGWPFA
jgi:NAD(P)-dependent dehydrogenase (short-subunit alcohol dehydrogenase family)